MAASSFREHRLKSGTARSRSLFDWRESLTGRV
jgi:hypothetical protein